MGRVACKPLTHDMAATVGPSPSAATSRYWASLADPWVRKETGALSCDDPWLRGKSGQVQRTSVYLAQL